jgi:hypothetical protein
MPDDPTELTVLVVDDDFMVASIHTRFVERTPGYRVVGTAATGGSFFEGRRAFLLQWIEQNAGAAAAR